MPALSRRIAARSRGRGRRGLSPVRWTPPAPSARAARKASDPPAEVRVIAVPGDSTEDVLVDADGSVLTPVRDGRILRISADGGRIDEVGNTGGRGLGLEFHPDGGLVVCDVERGLLRVHLADSVDSAGSAGTGSLVEVLVAEIDGIPMRFCNNCAVASDGTIYFTDSSTHFGIEEYKADLLEHAGTGRLFRRDPDSSVTMLLDGLHFPNGVALAENESYLVFAQTGAYSVHRLWLSGPRAGEREPFVTNLPGFPDNVSRGSDGLFWVALPSPRNRALDLLSPRPGFLRRVSWALPAALQPREGRTVFVQAFDQDGRLVHDLQQPNRDFYMVSGVRERDGVVWLGSLECSAIGRITL